MFTFIIRTLIHRPKRVGESEVGQASVEYALVLLGAALVATLLIGWATKTQVIGDLFDHVLSLIRGKAQ
jgi:Flp pilus assembly pilin Flp